MHTTGNTPSKSSYFLTIDWPWGLWGGGSWWGTPASAPPSRARRWGRGSGRSRPRWPRSCPCRGRPAAPPLNRSRWTSWKAAGGNWEFIFFVNRRLFLVEFCECLLAQAQQDSVNCYCYITQFDAVPIIPECTIVLQFWVNLDLLQWSLSILDEA